jgi:cohesin loading factor subunit SCC2
MMLYTERSEVSLRYVLSLVPIAAIYADVQLRLPEYFFDMYLDFSRYPIFQNAPSLCLGSLFHAYPALILREEATEWMDQVFKSSDYEGQAGLLKVIHDFLVSEAEKRAAGKVDPDIKALIGSSQDLTESGCVMHSDLSPVFCSSV